MVANMGNAMCIDVFGKHGPGLAVQMAMNKYDVCIIMAGTNDLSANQPAERIVGDIQALHNFCLAQGLRTIALPIPESRVVNNHACTSAGVVRATCNHLLQAWAATMPGRVLFVDMVQHIPYSDIDGNWSSDGLHMSAQGYAHFGSRLGHLIRDWVLGGVKTESRALKLETTEVALGVQTPRAPSTPAEAGLKAPTPRGPRTVVSAATTGADARRATIAKLQAQAASRRRPASAPRPLALAAAGRHVEKRTPRDPDAQGPSSSLSPTPRVYRAAGTQAEKRTPPGPDAQQPPPTLVLSPRVPLSPECMTPEGMTPEFSSPVPTPRQGAQPSWAPHVALSPECPPGVMSMELLDGGSVASFHAVGAPSLGAPALGAFVASTPLLM